MRLPKQASPVVRGVSTTRMKAAIDAQSCSVFDYAKCTAAFAILVAGPCDPVGFPEDLPVCIPAFAGFVDKCEDCIKGAAKSAICGAVSLAEKAGISIPSVLQSLCG